MAPPTDAEKGQLRANILEHLASTLYACSRLEELTSGTTNFVFRGFLKQPLQDGSKSIIVKQTTDYVAVNKDFPLDARRCVFEESMLHALGGFTQTTEQADSTVGRAAFEAKTPRLYWFNRDTNTQVLEDFHETTDLKILVLESAEPAQQNYLTDSPALAASIGRALGSWLQAFHAWTSAPAQSRQRQDIGTNEAMRKLKHRISYDVLIQVLSQFPGVLKDRKSTLEDVQAMAAQEFARLPSKDAPEDKNWVTIHGDFWSGNVLLPNYTQPRQDSPARQEIFVVDWEFAQYGHRAYDLGQMIGDLLERNHFNGAVAALHVLDGFVEGYGLSQTRDDDLAFRTAIHAGMQLIGVYTRRAPDGPLPGTPEQTASALQVGTELIVQGWARDRAWFESSILAKMFPKET